MVGEYYDKIVFDDTLFPVKACLGVRIAEGNVAQRSRLTWHEELEFKLYRRGGAKLQVGSEVLFAGDGDIVVANPCEPHCTISVIGECEYDVMILNVNFLREKFNSARCSAMFVPFVEGRLRFNRLVRGNARVRRAAEALFAEIAESGENGETAVVGVLLWLFSALLDGEVSGVLDRSAASGAGKLRKIQPAIEYVNRHYAESLSLDDLAVRCGLNSTYFSKLFKEVMRVNMKDYINQLRMNSAEVLLATTDDKITEIARACGAEDACYFDRWFKKHKGVTPGEYRKSKR